jgi:hypothetical protein
MKSVKYYLGFVLLSFSTINEIGAFINYVWLKKSIINIHFGYVIIYIVLPVVFLSSIILLFSYWDEAKSKVRLVFRYLFWIHIFEVMSLCFFFKNESYKLKFTVKNISNNNLEELRIIARDKLVYSCRHLSSKDSVVFVCDCREPQIKTERIGINVEYKDKLGEKIEYQLLSPNEPIYKNELKMFLGDTISIINHDIEGRWLRIDKQYSIYSTQEINQILK